MPRHAELTGIIYPTTYHRAFEDAVHALDKIGVAVESDGIRELLISNGCTVSAADKRAYPVVHIPEKVVRKAIVTVQPIVKMYDRNGNLAADLSGDNVNFNPGSCGHNYYDTQQRKIRPATAKDLEVLVRVADALLNIQMQSTAVVPSDITPAMQDVARLKIVLENSTKPVVTGTFGEHFSIMKDMLVAVRGNEGNLREKPLAIFDCCPSPTLIWSKIRSEDLTSCGKYGIPAEFISMPQPGLRTPGKLYDALVQHTAETLSGIVIAQLANPGAPLIYGGSPTMMANAPLLGNVGTLKVDLAYNQIGRNILHMPTQAYLGLSDSKSPDVQAGYEKAMTIVAATLAGVNNLSGPGMLESENCQSAAMLVIDDEICGSAQYLKKSLEYKSGSIDRLARVINDNSINEEDVRGLRSDEFYFGRIADTTTAKQYEAGGRQGMLTRAERRVVQILGNHNVPGLDQNLSDYLSECVERAGK